MRIGMVAGEISGDTLGARVLDVLAQRTEALVAEGVGGGQMRTRGLNSLYPMERLSVMGFSEPLRRLPELLRLRRRLARHFIDNPPDLFLGIDAPDFNLPLAKRLRRAGIPTVQLVSPSVWAWRAGRLRGIAEAVDLVLCLFPFEPPIYHAKGIAARYVGHPLATELDADADRETARQALGLGVSRGPILALLPGSRPGEVRRLAPLFLQVASQLCKANPALRCVLPVASDACGASLAPLLRDYAALPLVQVDERSREVLTASDVALLASGTATLEAMLLGRPMVVAWRTGGLSWQLLSRLVRTPYAALPNILANRALVPEFLQHAATTENLRTALEPLLDAPQAQAQCRSAFAALGANLALDFGRECGDALLNLVREKGSSVHGPV